MPCYNEARRLPADVFRRFAWAHPAIRFLMVDDGSKDDTAAVLAQLAADAPTVRTLGLSANQGKAEAVRQGLQWALAHDEPHAVGFWDADLATPLEDVPRFLALLDQRPALEIVIGSRVRLLGRHIVRHTWRHYLGRVAAFSVSNLLRLPVYDTQCGAKVFRATPQAAHLFERPFVTRWAFDVEILARWIGQRPHVPRDELERYIVEFPLQQWVDVAGSKLDPADILRTPADLLRIAWTYRRELGWVSEP